ncbi:hypothetical protein C8R44DRAFT_745526 [Mycena epipterygia]|nr:hypothetical protein C8R44DRAFT_745526 [Mycena epipterygia]
MPSFLIDIDPPYISISACCITGHALPHGGRTLRGGSHQKTFIYGAEADLLGRGIKHEGLYVRIAVEREGRVCDMTKNDLDMGQHGWRRETAEECRKFEFVAGRITRLETSIVRVRTSEMRRSECLSTAQNFVQHAMTPRDEPAFRSVSGGASCGGEESVGGQGFRRSVEEIDDRVDEFLRRYAGKWDGYGWILEIHVMISVQTVFESRDGNKLSRPPGYRMAPR